MTLARANPLNWGFNQKLTSAQINAIDSQLPNALDVINGGAYTMLAPVTIEGPEYWSFSNPVRFFGGVLVETAMTVTVGIVVDGGDSADVHWTSGATLRGDAGATMTWNGTADFGGAVTHNGIVTHNGAVDFEANLTHNNGAATFGGTLVHFGAPVTFVSSLSSLTIQADVPISVASPIALAAGGAVLARTLTGPNTDTVVPANTYDRIDVSTLTGPRTYTLADAPNGTEMIITTLNATPSTNVLTIQTATAVTVIQMRCADPGHFEWAHLIVRGGAWTRFDARITPI